ncbi:MAG TPA: cupin domain-containing protein [Chloroflexota bacterium]|jgi:quercetin dioxygenase-like cupin family protein|nr:cupin domain-containing protein [Chloroflexota bacterium]
MDQRTALIGVGHTIIIAAGQEDTGGAFALLDYEMAPGFAGPLPHIHQHEDEAAYVLEGQLLVRLGETERLVGPGEFVFLPRGIAHAQSNPGPEPARFLVLLIPAGFEQCFPDLEALLEAGAPCSPETIALLLARYGVRPLVETKAQQHASR